MDIIGDSALSKLAFGKIFDLMTYKLGQSQDEVTSLGTGTDVKILDLLIRSSN